MTGSEDSVAITAAVSSFESAVISADFSPACDQLTTELQERFKRLVGKMFGRDDVRCPKAVELLTQSTSPYERREVTDIDVDGDRATVRVDGNPSVAYVFERRDTGWLIAVLD